MLAACACATHAATAAGQQDEAGTEAGTAPRTAVQLDAVEVTARRRLEPATAIPAPITVLGGTDLERDGIFQLQDLQHRLPGLATALWNPRQSSVAIRGIGNYPANDGLEGSVGLVLDNVYLGRPGMALFDLLDIERIELLRGPQGTLFGKNATAGVLSIHTRPPGFEPEVAAALSIGQRGHRQASASVSDRLGKALAGRLTAYSTHDDGWVRNLADGRRLNDIARQGVRGQLLFQPRHDGTSVRLIADYHRQDDSQGVPLLYHQGTAPPLYLALLPEPGADDYTTRIDGRQHLQVDQGGVSAQVDVGFDGGHQLTSVTAWRFWDFAPVNDVDLSPHPIIEHAGYAVDHRQALQELRLASPGGERFDYVVGAFLLDLDTRNAYANDFGPMADAALVGPVAGALRGVLDDVRSTTRGRIRTRSAALFGQGDWRLSDRLGLDAGLRWTVEDKRARIIRDPPQGGSDFADLPPPLAAALLAVRHGQAGAWDSGNFGFSDAGPSWLLGLNYRFGEGMLGYATLSHGEKSGAINANAPTPQIAALPLPVAQQSLMVAPEIADNIELGFKGALLDRRLQLNLNLFVARIRDYQANAIVPYTNPATGIAGVAHLLTSVDGVESRGLEWDLHAIPTDGWTLVFNGAYNEARYRRFANAPCPAETIPPPANGCSLDGRPLNGAPRWTFNLGSDYRWLRHGAAEHYVSAHWTWRSGTYGSLDDSIHNRLPAYGLLNLTAGWRIDRGAQQWDLSLWVRNALDERYFPTGGQLLNTYVATAGMPRTVGATLRYGFR